MKLPVLWFVPITSYPGMEHHQKEHVPIISAPSLQVFMNICKIEPKQSFQPRLKTLRRTRQQGQTVVL